MHTCAACTFIAVTIALVLFVLHKNTEMIAFGLYTEMKNLVLETRWQQSHLLTLLGFYYQIHRIFLHAVQLHYQVE